MRWTIALSVIVLVHTSSTAVSQITLREKNAPLQKIITAIEKQTKYVFLYDPEELKTPPITISIKNATLQQTLTKCFEGQPIEFTIVGNSVLLKKAPQQNPPPTSPIHGKVTDDAGQPMQGVTVFNKREKKATQTDSSGAYTLQATKSDALTFTFVGYTPRETTIGNQPAVNVTLEPNPANPEQVVVVGYGSSKKRDLTGAISIIDLKNKEAVPFNTVDNLLAGQAAGVQVTKSDGTPGGISRIRIRGTSSLLGGNEPLYVIDGIPIQVRNNFIDPGFKVASPAVNLTNAFNGKANGAALPASFINGLNSLAGLDPNEIESITILKDASSTAIYGSKGANGVVIIMTRTGKENTSPQVTLDSYTTLNSPLKIPRLLNASEYKRLLTEAAQNAFDEDARGYRSGPPTASILDSPAYFGAANTNWIRQVTRTAVSNNTGLSVSGGGKGSRYFGSIAYNNTPGVVDATDFRRIAGKFNLETQIGSRLKVVANLLLGYTRQNLGVGAYAQAFLARPDWAPRDATGNYTDFTLQGGGFGQEGFLNPVALLTATNQGNTGSLLGSVSGVYNINNDLRFKTTVSVNSQTYNQRNFLPGYIAVNGSNGNIANPGGVGSNANSRFADWFLENTLTYTRQFDKQAADIVIGQSYETTKYGWFRATATGFSNNTTLTSLSSASTPLSVAGDDPRSPQSYLISFYARANYSYRDKYLLTFTGRADGSSKFGPENKYGYFPSGALAWRISRENFLKTVKALNDLKFRISYGLTGNQNIGDQMYRTLYSPTSYNGANAIVPTQLGNQGIKWESTKEADVGMDLSLFTGRLNATFDYYNKQTNGDLLSLPVAASSSYGSLLANTVGLRTRGFEATLGGEVVRGGEFSWNVSLNVTWAGTSVTRLDPHADPSVILGPSGQESIRNSQNLYAGNTTILQGKPLGLITGFIITGIIKTQAQLDAYNKRLGNFAATMGALQIGDPMYQLTTPSASAASVRPASNLIIANGSPKYFGGINQGFRYRRVDLQCNFTFSMGGHLLLAEQQANGEFYWQANASRSILNRYTPENTASNQPRLSLNHFQTAASNLDVFSSSYLKLRSVTLNYRFSAKNISIKDAQIFISATNLFTITKYPGSDPETSDDPYSVSGGFMDTGNYPATRTFSFGLKATF
jgi:TonB-linked SusC/RagA family outer membrane protein